MTATSADLLQLACLGLYVYILRMSANKKIFPSLPKVVETVLNSSRARTLLFLLLDVLVTCQTKIIITRGKPKMPLTVAMNGEIR